MLLLFPFHYFFFRNENTDFAWCPGKRISTDCDEYVEIDMGELNIITKVVISGLLAEGGVSICFFFNKEQKIKIFFLSSNYTN